MKYHVVFKGWNTGVYTTWMECRRQVSGYPGNLHNSYGTRQEAEEALATFKRLEPGNVEEVEPVVQPIVNEEKNKHQGFQLSVKDIILCLLIVVVIMQSYYLYK
jgi:viroplasmin and RNaseH domain-containing protein